MLAASYPLPVYSTPQTDAIRAQLAKDAVEPVETEVSPFVQYGVLPVSVLGMAALMANEIFLINEEALIMGTFGGFLLTFYVQFGSVIRKEFGDRSRKMRQYVSLVFC